MIYIHICFLTVVSIVQVKALDVEGRVGEDVTVTCSDWNAWTGVKHNEKYLCESPCSEDEHIIIKAAFKETKYKNRIKITNSAGGLFVTFINLTMSDSTKYYCGAKRFGRDSLIEVNLKVVDGSTTPVETVSVGSTVSSAAMNSLTTSSDSSVVIAGMSNATLHTTAPTTSATQGTGNASYLIGGLLSIIPVVMILLMLTRKMVKKQQMVVTTPPEDIGQSAGPDGASQSPHSMLEGQNNVYSTLSPTSDGADPDGVYQSCHPSSEDQNQVYSNLTSAKCGAGPDGIYETLHPSTRDPDHVYDTLRPTSPLHILQSAALELTSVDTRQTEDAETGVM